MKPKKRSSKAKDSLWPAQDRRSSSSLKYHRFIGISLGGGKSDRTAITVLEYYVDQKKLIVSRLIDRLKTEGELSSDLRLHEYVQQFKSDVELVGMDVPLSLPKCFTCQLTCPGYEFCQEEEILWMWKQHRLQAQKKKNTRGFTPYTQRCVEMLWGEELEGPWAVGDSLGANTAPLLARGRFIRRRWEHDVIEVIPRLSVLRWARAKKLSKIQLKSYRHSVDGLEARAYLMKQLIDDMEIFIYEQDKYLFVDNLVAFESLWIALTAFWKFQKKCESKPKLFPKNEGWIEVPEFK
ncbi:MAG: hypothetical protein RJB66_1200 [Pseudomonadota bacterium]|jgi:predicted nuclease with RNAse H fold